MAERRSKFHARDRNPCSPPGPVLGTQRFEASQVLIVLSTFLFRREGEPVSDAGLALQKACKARGRGVNSFTRCGGQASGKNPRACIPEPVALIPGGRKERPEETLTPAGPGTLGNGCRRARAPCPHGSGPNRPEWIGIRRPIKARTLLKREKLREWRNWQTHWT